MATKILLREKKKKKPHSFKRLGLLDETAKVEVKRRGKWRKEGHAFLQHVIFDAITKRIVVGLRIKYWYQSTITCDCFATDVIRNWKRPTMRFR